MACFYVSFGGILACVYMLFLVRLSVAGRPPFGKELLTWLIVYSLCFMSTCMFCYFPFGFEGMILVLIALSAWLLVDI